MPHLDWALGSSFCAICTLDSSTPEKKKPLDFGLSLRYLFLPLAHPECPSYDIPPEDSNAWAGTIYSLMSCFAVGIAGHGI